MITKLVNKIRKIISEAIEYFSGMSVKQKFVSSIIFLVCIFVIVKLFNSFISSTSGSLINYKEETGSSIFLQTTVLNDNDLYVTLKLIADDFISKCEGNESYNSDTITLSNIYDNIMYTSYTSSISKSKFTKIVNTFLENAVKIEESGIEVVPTNIVKYSDNYYLVKYQYDVGEENITLYIGIVLDTTNEKYYVWYLE